MVKLRNFVVGARGGFYLLFTFFLYGTQATERFDGSVEVRMCNEETKQLLQTALFQTCSATTTDRT